VTSLNVIKNPNETMNEPTENMVYFQMPEAIARNFVGTKRDDFSAEFSAARPIFVPAEAFEGYAFAVTEEIGSLPFETCYFEIFTQNKFFKFIDAQHPERSLNFWGMVVKEMGPGIVKVWGVTPEGIIKVATDGRVITGINNILKYMKKAESGIVSTRRRYKTRGLTGRFSHIIYMNTRSKSSSRPTFSKKIDWKYSFEVRGHWRKHIGLGKNRSGERVVDGATWVKDHARGEGALIRKFRLLKEK